MTVPTKTHRHCHRPVEEMCFESPDSFVCWSEAIRPDRQKSLSHGACACNDGQSSPGNPSIPTHAETGDFGQRLPCGRGHPAIRRRHGITVSACCRRLGPAPLPWVLFACLITCAHSYVPYSREFIPGDPLSKKVTLRRGYQPLAIL